MSIVQAIISSGGGDPNATTFVGSWETATIYKKNNQVAVDGDLFLAIATHTSGATTEPGVGANWTDAWVRQIDSVNANQLAGLAGTEGTPGSGNKYVTDSDSRMDDARTPTSHTHAEDDITDLGDYVLDNDTRLPRTVAKTETGDLSAADVTNTIISNYGQGAAMTLTLPTAAANMGFVFVVGTTGNALHIKAGANDKIIWNGLALDDADKVSLATPVVGNCITFFTFQTGASTYDWIATSIDGVWTDGGQ